MEKNNKKGKEEYLARVQKLYNECLTELERLGIDLAKNIKGIVINERAKKRLGCCRKKGNQYEIEVSSMLNGEDDNIIKEVIIHELLHTCRGCMNHGSEWKRRTKIINDQTDYNINTTAEKYFTELKKKNQIEYKYIIKCRNCGFETYRLRKSKVIEKTENYKCPKCGGRLKVIKM